MSSKNTKLNLTQITAFAASRPVRRVETSGNSKRGILSKTIAFFTCGLFCSDTVKPATVIRKRSTIEKSIDYVMDNWDDDSLDYATKSELFLNHALKIRDVMIELDDTFKRWQNRRMVIMKTMTELKTAVAIKNTIKTQMQAVIQNITVYVAERNVIEIRKANVIQELKKKLAKINTPDITKVAKGRKYKGLTANVNLHTSAYLKYQKQRKYKGKKQGFNKKARR